MSIITTLFKEGQQPPIVQQKWGMVNRHHINKAPSKTLPMSVTTPPISGFNGANLAALSLQKGLFQSLVPGAGRISQDGGFVRIASAASVPEDSGLGVWAKDMAVNTPPVVPASICSGLLEISLLHWLDTIRKRFQADATITKGATPQEKSAVLKRVMLQDSEGVIGIIRSLYQGVGAAMAYKVPQRLLVFMIQDQVKSMLTRDHKELFDDVFGKESSKSVIGFLAGATAGVSEAAVILPLDVLKIVKQVKGGTISEIVKDTVRTKGIGGFHDAFAVTAVRNFWGTGIWFLSAEKIRSLFPSQEDGTKTVGQDLLASAGSGFFRVATANPFDVVRVKKMVYAQKNVDSNASVSNVVKLATQHAKQNTPQKPGEPLPLWKAAFQTRPTPPSAWSVAKTIMKTEGPRGFFRGLGTSAVTAAPKAGVSMFAFLRVKAFVEESQQKNGREYC